MRRSPQVASAWLSRPRRRGGEACRATAHRAARRGFTLLEVMLVIALLAVAGTLFFVNLESLGRSSPADEFEGAFWRALALARERALASRRTVELRWDEETKAFRLDGAGGVASVQAPSSAMASDTEYVATFSEEVAANDFILVRGELVARRATSAVKVFPDGTCQAFAVEFQLGEHRHRVSIDPWTGSEMLPLGATGKGGRS